jgi:hypothetical protein
MKDRLVGRLQVRILCCLRHDPQSVGWAKAAPTYQLIRDARSAVPTSSAAGGTADHVPCPSSRLGRLCPPDVARLGQQLTTFMESLVEDP